MIEAVAYPELGPAGAVDRVPHMLRPSRLRRQPAETRSCIRVPLLAAAGTILLLSACAGNPPPPSGDTYCERARHISATDEQIKVFADNWAVMEPYADQILTHNAVYDAACLKEPK